MSPFDRRAFLKTGSLALAATAIPYGRPAAMLADTAPLPDSPELRALLAASLDAARAAGAAYADAHFRVVRQENWMYFMGLDYPTPYLQTEAGLGVRALFNGYWGFAALSGNMSLSDAAQLGRDAMAQARIASKGKPRTADLAPTAVVNGTWIMPVEIDPFTVSYEEKADFLLAMSEYWSRQRYGVGTQGVLNFKKEERTFASSEGSSFAQTVFVTGGSLGLGVPPDWLSDKSGGRSADFLSPAGAGWEYIRRGRFKEDAERMIDEAYGMRRPKTIDVGRYDIVFDAEALAGILGNTIGTATELDRALGYEANFGGTSYLNDPLGMLGTYKMGSPILNVSMNRSMPGGAATVKWDDEGVEPVDTPLVKDGVLTDFQTTREAAHWIAPYYERVGKSIRSNGCAGVLQPTTPLMQCAPNLVLAPGAGSTTFEDLIKDTPKGLAIIGGSSYSDHQALNGQGGGEVVYEIVNGKLGTVFEKTQFLFRAPDFWKNLVGLGGKNTVRQYGFERWRSGGRTAHTVAAVPGKVTGVAVTELGRKA